MAKPTYRSATPTDTDISTAHVGAGLLGLPLLPQGEHVARVLEARNRNRDEVKYQDAVIEIPRQSAKTTTVWSVILGRAATRDRYQAVTTAQTATIARRVLVGMGMRMVRNGTACLSKDRDTHPDLPALYLGTGTEHLVWPSGNEILAVPPDAGAVRSMSADDIVVDEGGELDPVKGQDFIDAVRPLQDTRGPLAQFILAGTPGKVRTGPFWDLLEKGRNHAERDLGIVDYSIRDNEDSEDRKVWRRVHPGPASGLTPMRVLEKRHKDYGPVRFGREYLCRWPFDNTVSAIDIVEWKAQQVDVTVPPAWCGVGFDAEPAGMSAAIAVAWRTAGVPVVALVDYRSGTTWLPAALRALRERHPRVPIANDVWGPTQPTVEALEREVGRKHIDVQRPGFKGMAGATQTFVQRLPVHVLDENLERAVESAAWRETEQGRLFARKNSKADVSPLVACTLALWAYDNAVQRSRLGIPTVSSDTPT